MAMEAQGIFVRRASTVTLSVTSAATIVDIQSTMISITSGVDFVTLGFTTAYVIAIDSTANTGIYPIKNATTTALHFYEAFGTTVGSSAFNITGYLMGEVKEITDFTGPGGAAAIIDITHLQSTAKEKMIGLRDEGQLNLTLNYNATDTGQLGLITDRAQRTKNLYDITFRDTTWTASALPSRAWFWGYCMQFSVTGSVDNKVAANSVIEITGPVVYTTRVTT